MKLKQALFGIAAIGGIALTSSAASAQPNRLSEPRSHLSGIGARCVCDPYGHDFHGRTHLYGRPWAYGGRHLAYPEDEHWMSPAEQASEEGGR
jgi:hypothetical protein